MKKLLSLTLILIMLLGTLASCNVNDTSTNSNSSTDTKADIQQATNTDIGTDTSTDIEIGDETKLEQKYAFHRPYKRLNMHWTSEARIWDWEDLATFERYHFIRIGDISYFSTGRLIEKELLGESLGKFELTGADFDGIKGTEIFSAYEINYVSSSCAVAVEIENKYYVYTTMTKDKPQTLGDLLELYDLMEIVSLKRFHKKGYTDDGKNAIGNDDYIWEILYSCKDARLCEDEQGNWKITGNKITFSVTSQQLGVYKVGFEISKSGYIQTNMLGYTHTYFIGEESAEKIISYTISNSYKAPLEEYEYSIVGYVTEIKDGYILVDDTAFCENAQDGMTFKVSIESVKIQRKCVGIEVGDLMAVFFELEQNQAEIGIIENPKTVSGGMFDGIDSINIYAKYE